MEIFFGGLKDFLKSQTILCGELKIVLESRRIFGELKNFLGANRFFGSQKIFGGANGFLGGAEKFLRNLNDFLVC